MTRFAVVSLIFVVVNFSPAQTQLWQATSGPYGGTGAAFIADETGLTIAGTNNGGIFLSTDFGLHWHITGFDLQSSPITSFVRARHIFAGTFGQGVYRSTDLGNTWAPTNAGIAELNVQSIVVDSGGWLFASHSNFHVSRSTDEGSTWTIVNNGLTFPDVLQLAVDPQGYLLAGTNGGGIFRTTDRGTTWSRFDTSDLVDETRYLVVNHLGYVFAGNAQGLYRSTNNGLTWLRLPTGTFPDQIRALAISPDATLFIGASAGVLRSTDDGDSWDIVGPILFDSTYTVHPVAFAFAGPGRMFAGASNLGIYLSTDYGDTWVERSDGLSNCLVLSLGTSRSGLLMAGIMNGASLFLSSNSGLSWARSGRGLGGQVVTCTGSSSSSLFVGTEQNVYASSDAGATWVPKGSGLFWSDIRVLAYHAKTQALFAGTTGGLYKTTNGGDDWIPSGIQYKAVGAISVGEEDDFYAAVGDAFGQGQWRVHRSTDAGEHWTPTQLEGLYISSVQVDRNQNVFASLFSFSRSGVFRSTDRGLTWTHSNQGLGDSIVHTIIVNPEGTLFASTINKGVFRSDDAGENWIDWNSGLYNPEVHAFTLDSQGFLFAATNGNGVFRTVQSTTAVQPIEQQLPHTVLLYQNYPNPFNPATTIKYELPQRSYVAVILFNTLGRQISQLVNEQQEPGNHELILQMGQFASGVYFYQLRVGQHIETRKLVLLR